MSFLDLNFDTDLDFGFGKNPEDDRDKAQKEFLQAAHIPYKPVCYANAQEMASEIDITKDYFCLVAGSFVFGDLFEALLDKYQKPVKEMYISTLGMSEDNIDSIVNLVRYLGVEKLYLIVSCYFWGVERKKMVPYLIKEFKGLPIQVAVVGSHAKITLMDFGDMRVVIHGSANLSSSRNLETFYITHDDNIYHFVKNIYDHIVDEFTVVAGLTGGVNFEKNNNNRVSKLWGKIKNWTKEA